LNVFVNLQFRHFSKSAVCTTGKVSIPKLIKFYQKLSEGDEQGILMLTVNVYDL